MSAQIEPEALKALLEQNKVKIIDASWALDGTDMHALYLKAHISTAHFFDIEAISDKSTDLPHMAPTPDQFAKAMGAMGISENDHVVIYDQQGLFSSPRVWWTFRLMGHEKVQVLRGGLPAWQALKFEVTSQINLIEKGVYTPNYNSNLVININELKKSIELNSKRILDARPKARFYAQQAEPRLGLRSGHMPKSNSLPATELILEGRLLPLDELKQKFDAFELSYDTEIVTTCGSGVTAAILSLALFEMGYTETALFDGSWAQWGRSDQATEVITD
jgi:thiosulfate/3-mercaptopyruvate sulfurtransferase